MKKTQPQPFRRIASIGPGGIEIGLPAPAGGPDDRLQSDREELKTYLADRRGRQRQSFNRTGRN